MELCRSNDIDEKLNAVLSATADNLIQKGEIVMRFIDALKVCTRCVCEAGVDCELALGSSAMFSSAIRSTMNFSLFSVIHMGMTTG